MKKLRIGLIFLIFTLAFSACTATPTAQSNTRTNFTRSATRTGSGAAPGGFPLSDQATEAPTDTPTAAPSATATITNTPGPTQTPTVTAIPFTVTQVFASPALNSYNIQTSGCTATYTFSANILANGAGKVVYHWVRSDGSTTPQATLEYTAAGFQKVTDSWTVSSASFTVSGTDRIYIDQPNDKAFDAVGFSVSCEPPAAPGGGRRNNPRQ